MKDIPEIIWPSGYTTHLFTFRYNFENISVLIKDALYFEDSDIAGKIRLYYLTYCEPILLYNHMDLDESLIMVYTDKYGNPKEVFNFVVDSLNIQTKDVLWIKTVVDD